MGVADLVERHPDPTDRRASLIALTPTGQQACDQLEPEHAHNAAAAFTTLTATERDTLLQLITKVSDHLENLGRRSQQSH